MSVFPLKLYSGSSLPQHLPIPSMIVMDQANDLHSVPVSQDVHTQGHSQHHLFLPEINFTSTTGPQRLQRHHGMQTPLLLRLHNAVLFLGESKVCSLCGHLICSARCHLPSPPACLCSEAKPLHTQSLGCLVADFATASLLSALVSQLRCCRPDIH